jgi:hypothetical protein
MYASVRTYRFGSGSIDDLMHTIDTGFAEELAQELGFIGYQAVDLGNGKVCTITMFTSSEQAEASNDMAAAWVAENLGEFDVERMGVIGGEVMVSRAQAELLEPAHH